MSDPAAPTLQLEATYPDSDDSEDEGDVCFGGGEWEEEEGFLSPYCPCPLKLVEKALVAAGCGPDSVVLDLGCGDGRVVVTSIVRFGAAKAIGVELDPNLIARATTKASAFGDAVKGKTHFLQEDFTKLDFNSLADVTILILYVLPDAIDALRAYIEKLLEEGQTVVSVQFPIPWLATWNVKTVDGRIFVYKRGSS